MPHTFRVVPHVRYAHKAIAINMMHSCRDAISSRVKATTYFGALKYQFCSHQGLNEYMSITGSRQCLCTTAMGLVYYCGT